jgi:hypothetical protein
LLWIFVVFFHSFCLIFFSSLQFLIISYLSCFIFLSTCSTVFSLTNICNRFTTYTFPFIHILPLPLSPIPPFKYFLS